jgi:hypothetical protein
MNDLEYLTGLRNARERTGARPKKDILLDETGEQAERQIKKKITSIYLEPVGRHGGPYLHLAWLMIEELSIIIIICGLVLYRAARATAPTSL